MAYRNYFTVMVTFLIISTVQSSMIDDFGSKRREFENPGLPEVPESYGEIEPSPKTAVTNASFYLEQRLLKGYSRRAIPNENNTQPFWIYTDLTLYQLLELNFRLQMIKVLIWETTNWKDVNLRWNPDDYAGIKSIRLMDTDIWTPDLVISESIAEEESGVNPLGVSVTYDGTVLWMRPKILTAACSINVLYFPNDRQECSLTIGSWYYTEDYIRIAFHDTDKGPVQFSDLSLTKVHDEWNIVSLVGQMITADYAQWGNYSELSYKLKLSRKPLFYHINFILPTIVIGLLGTCMFFIPITSGEKVSFGITLLLALTVNQLIVSEKLPVTSENLPFLCIYFLVTIILNSFAICACLVVYNIHTHASPYPVPATLKFICFKVLHPVFSFQFSAFCNTCSIWCKTKRRKLGRSKYLSCAVNRSDSCVIHANCNANGANLNEKAIQMPKLAPNSKWKIVQRAMRQGKLKRELWNEAGFMSHKFHAPGSKFMSSSKIRFDPEKMMKSLHEVVDQMTKNKEDWMRVATIIDKGIGVVYLVTMVTVDFMLLHTLTYRTGSETLTGKSSH